MNAWKWITSTICIITLTVSIEVHAYHINKVNPYELHTHDDIKVYMIKDKRAKRAKVKDD